MHPRFSILACEQLVGFCITHDFVLGGVPGERAAELHREVGEDAAGGADVALLDVGAGPAAAGDGGEEVPLVGAVGGGGVQLHVFLGLVLGVLVLGVEDGGAAERGLLFAGGDEVVTV